MVTIYQCPIDTSEDVRSRQINSIRADLVARLIGYSDLPPTGIATVTVNVRKLRDRSKVRTHDRYVISAYIAI